MSIYLGLTGVIFVVIGLRALFSPQAAVAEPFSIIVDSVDAKNFIRAGTGSVTLCFGVLFLTAIFYERFQFTALVSSTLIMGGLIIGRIVSLSYDGKPGRLLQFSLGGEALGFISGLYWLLNTSFGTI